MKYLILLMVAIAACAALAKTSTPEGWTDDYDAALRWATAQKKLVLVDFSGSDWCGWCKKLDKEVFDTDEFRAGAKDKYILLMIDTPRDQSLLSETAKKQNPELVKKYRVEGFPTVLLLDAQGEELFRTGYEKGGPVKYLKMLEEEVKFGPDIKKYIKPIEDVLNRHDDEMQKEMEAIKDKVEEAYPDVPTNQPLIRLRREQKRRERKMVEMAKRIMFEEVLAKYIPIYDKAFAEAKEMKVPAHMQVRKLELINGQERNFQAMKMAKAQYDLEAAKRKTTGAADEEDEKPPTDGRWHGLDWADVWAEGVRTNAALPTAWKYFTEQFRPYVRRNLMVPEEGPFAKEIAALVDDIARTLWTPSGKWNAQWVIREDFNRAAELRDKGCSNLTVRALATIGDYNRHMKEFGSISTKGKEYEPYRQMAAELATQDGVPLLGRLYAEQINGSVCAAAAVKGMVAGLKDRPQDLRIVYNLIGSPVEARAVDPWFGLMADAEAERKLAWKARGGGYANEVSKDGWKGFEEHLAKARELLDKAYALHPEVPETAVAILEVEAPRCEGDEKERWFARVLELEVDNRAAWSKYSFHALPRWGGTCEGLRMLSEALWMTDRKDTFFRYKAAQLLATADKEEDGNGRFFRDPVQRARYLEGCRGVIDGEMVDDDTALFARKGIVDRYWDAGEMEEAGKTYQELIARAPCRFRTLGAGWGEPMDLIIPALGGAHAKELAAMETCYQKNIAKVKKPSESAREEARALIKPLVAKLSELSAAEKRLVYLRKGQLGIADEIGDDWVEMPVDEGFPGWKFPSGSARHYWKCEGGAYRAVNSNMEIEWGASLPADYELELDVQFGSMLGIELERRAFEEKKGCPNLAISLAKGKWCAELFSSLWNWDERKAQAMKVELQVKKPAERHKLLIAVRGGSVSITVDGEKMLDSCGHLSGHFGAKRPDSTVRIRGKRLNLFAARFRRAPKK